MPAWRVHVSIPRRKDGRSGFGGSFVEVGRLVAEVEKRAGLGHAEEEREIEVEKSTKQKGRRRGEEIVSEARVV